MIHITLEGSYVDEDEADTFFEYNPLAVDFIEADKEYYLSEATRVIDSLPLRGNRYEMEYIYNGTQKDTNLDGEIQDLEFPRYIDGVCCDYDFGTNLPIIPKRVKDACCLIAFNMYLKTDETNETTAIDELALQQKGITSFSLGKLSMSFGGAGSADSYYGFYGLTRESYNLLRRYIESTPYIL